VRTGARTWGGPPGRITAIDAHYCALDLSGDSRPRIAAILTGIDADYSVDATPTCSTIRSPSPIAPDEPCVTLARALTRALPSRIGNLLRHRENEQPLPD
jgi:hypothetical protein